MERRSESITNLAVALSAAQSEIKAAVRDAEDPYHESRYATLASAWEAVRLPLGTHGLALAQLPAATGPQVTVTTLLLHKSGEWLASDLTMTSSSASPQALGSAITYARRYSMMAMLGIAPEDDDANSAEGRKKGETKTSMKEAQAEVRNRKLRQAKEGGTERAAQERGLTKAAPPPIPPFPEAELGVGPHDITLEDRLEASIKVAQKKEPFKDMLDSFGHLKEQCLTMGRLNIYYDALEAYGVKHANQFKDFEKARQCYRLLAQMVADAKGIQGPSPEQEAAEERQAIKHADALREQ